LVDNGAESIARANAFKTLIKLMRFQMNNPRLPIFSLLNAHQISLLWLALSLLWLAMAAFQNIVCRAIPSYPSDQAALNKR
jgi:hypothetical protein